MSIVRWVNWARRNNKGVGALLGVTPKIRIAQREALGARATSLVPSTASYSAASPIFVQRATMSTKKQEGDPLAKKPIKNCTQFDHILASDTINLKLGAPGEPLLKKSKDIIKKATVHKMVSHYVG